MVTRHLLVGATVLLSACFGTYDPLVDAESESSTTSAMASETKLDLLILVDRRAEFEPKARSLLPAFFQLQDEFVSSLTAVSSYHVGVTSMADVRENEDAGCREIGSLFRASRPLVPPDSGETDCAAILRGHRYVSSDDIPESEIGAALECVLVAQTYPEGEDVQPRPIDAMFAALSPPANADSGCNAGFFRPDAGLVVMFVTDRDATERQDAPAEWMARLVAKQQVDLAGNIGLVMFVGTAEGPTSTSGDTTGTDTDTDGDTDSGEVCESTHAQLLLEFAGFRMEDRTAQADICDPPAIIDAFERLALTIIPTVASPPS
jgi:hypothetical protein